MYANNAANNPPKPTAIITSRKVVSLYHGAEYLSNIAITTITAIAPAMPKTTFTSFLTSVIPHSPRDFSYSSMSLFTTSLNVRTLNSNLKSASLSYTSRCKRTCTYSFPFFGPPLVLGDMVYKIFFEYFNLPYSKFTQLIKSITLFRRCVC